MEYFFRFCNAKGAIQGDYWKESHHYLSLSNILDKIDLKPTLPLTSPFCHPPPFTTFTAFFEDDDPFTAPIEEAVNGIHYEQVDGWEGAKDLFSFFASKLVQEVATNTVNFLEEGLHFARAFLLWLEGGGKAHVTYALLLKALQPENSVGALLLGMFGEEDEYNWQRNMDEYVRRYASGARVIRYGHKSYLPAFQNNFCLFPSANFPPDSGYCF